MRLRHVAMIPALAGLLLMSAGCAESYEDRMKFLDQMSEKGVEYRGQLQQQGTELSEQACSDGYELLDPDIPYDTDGDTPSQKWKDQVKEAYMKSCLTGALRPKPDPSGVKAVTPVPHGSEPPSPSASASPAVTP
jgi:hypothetical protein